LEREIGDGDSESEIEKGDWKNREIWKLEIRKLEMGRAGKAKVGEEDNHEGL